MAVEDRLVSVTDYPSLEKATDIVIKDKQKFERLVVSKEKLLEILAVRMRHIHIDHPH